MILLIHTFLNALPIQLFYAFVVGFLFFSQFQLLDENLSANILQITTDRRRRYTLHVIAEEEEETNEHKKLLNEIQQQI